MPSFTLKPVVPEDVPALCELAGKAFEDDRHTLLKASHPTNPYDHASGMKGAFEHWLTVPDKIQSTKAVDDETGDILGVVFWGIRLDQPPPVPHSTAKEPSNAVKTSDPELDALGQLNEFTSQHLADFMDRVMPDGVRCMYIVTITVHPSHRGRGVGTALVKQGTDRADAEGVFCWVHSSEAGASLFAACGFEVDDTLELDLDEPARKMGIKPPAGEEKWGTYTFKYCIRKPRL